MNKLNPKNIIKCAAISSYLLNLAVPCMAEPQSPAAKALEEATLLGKMIEMGQCLDIIGQRGPEALLDPIINEPCEPNAKTDVELALEATSEVNHLNYQPEFMVGIIADRIFQKLGKQAQQKIIMQSTKEAAIQMHRLTTSTGKTGIELVIEAMENASQRERKPVDTILMERVEKQIMAAKVSDQLIIGTVSELLREYEEIMEERKEIEAMEQEAMERKKMKAIAEKVARSKGITSEKLLIRIVQELLREGITGRELLPAMDKRLLRMADEERQRENEDEELITKIEEQARRKGKTTQELTQEAVAKLARSKGITSELVLKGIVQELMDKGITGPELMKAAMEVLLHLVAQTTDSEIAKETIEVPPYTYKEETIEEQARREGKTTQELAQEAVAKLARCTGKSHREIGMEIVNKLQNQGKMGPELQRATEEELIRMAAAMAE